MLDGHRVSVECVRIFDAVSIMVLQGSDLQAQTFMEAVERPVHCLPKCWKSSCYWIRLIILNLCVVRRD